MAEILIGTSGYSYDDWRGRFYPLRLAKGNMLAYYAREFSFTEVNSTYYRIPPPQVLTRLAEVTPARFVFTVKAHGSLTHERDRELGANAAKFNAALAPLRAAGKLGAVLFQFPYSFRKQRENEDYLARLGDAFSGIPGAVEFRNAGWVEQSTWELLRTALSGLFRCARALSPTSAFTDATRRSGGGTAKRGNDTISFIQRRNLRNGYLACGPWRRVRTGLSLLLTTIPAARRSKTPGRSEQCSTTM